MLRDLSARPVGGEVLPLPQHLIDQLIPGVDADMAPTFKG